MKIALVVLLVAVVALAWRLNVVNATLGEQRQQIRTLTTALADRSKREALALQTDCSATASRFLVSRGWKAGDGSDYRNHFNVTLNKCFVLVSAYVPNEDFRTLDLYDAVEGRHYAMYVGHNMCDAAISRNPKHCAMDSGMIWSDGNDRNRSDFTVGFRGLLYGGGAGDENTQNIFMEHIQRFMNE
jgi:hypothetical protein